MMWPNGTARPFVSMEYVDGEDLAVAAAPHRTAVAGQGARHRRQVCAGLAAAHDRGVLHRDLKPANVMLDGRGKVRITDFGLASFADDDRRGEVAGTPAYMAPEQVAGGALSLQTDLYAVGLLLFELLTGSPAHQSTSVADRRQQPAAPTPQLPTSVRAAIDPRIVDVVDSCLALDPARRPASALALAAALPGGDPLAAALAAGETPAPHVVAHATDEQLLRRPRRWPAWSCSPPRSWRCWPSTARTSIQVRTLPLLTGSARARGRRKSGSASAMPSRRETPRTGS